MCPNMADKLEILGAYRVDYQTIILRSNDFVSICIQQQGWRTDIQNKKYGVN